MNQEEEAKATAPPATAPPPTELLRGKRVKTEEQEENKNSERERPPPPRLDALPPYSFPFKGKATTKPKHYMYATAEDERDLKDLKCEWDSDGNLLSMHGKSLMELKTKKETPPLLEGIFVPSDARLVNRIRKSDKKLDELFTWAVIGAHRWYNEDRKQKIVFPAWNAERTRRQLIDAGIETKKNQIDPEGHERVARFLLNNCIFFKERMFLEHPNRGFKFRYKTDRGVLFQAMTAWFQEEGGLPSWWMSTRLRRKYIFCVCKAFGAMDRGKRGATSHGKNYFLGLKLKCDFSADKAEKEKQWIRPYDQIASIRFAPQYFQRSHKEEEPAEVETD